MVQQPFSRALEASRAEQERQRRLRELQLVADQIAPGATVQDPDAFEQYIGVQAVRISEQTGQPPEELIAELVARSQQEGYEAQALTEFASRNPGLETLPPERQRNLFLKDQVTQLGGDATVSAPGTGPDSLLAENEILSQRLTALRSPVREGGPSRAEVQASIPEYREGAGRFILPGISERLATDPSQSGADILGAVFSPTVGLPEQDIQNLPGPVRPIVRGAQTTLSPGGILTGVAGPAALGASGLAARGGVTGAAARFAADSPGRALAGELGGNIASEAAAEANAPLPVQIGAGIAGGVGAAGAPGAIRRAANVDGASIRRGVDSVSPIGTARAAGPEDAVPSPSRPIDVEVDEARSGNVTQRPQPKPAPDTRFIGTVDTDGAIAVPADNIFGIRQLSSDLGVTRGQTVLNRVRSAIPQRVREAPVARTILREGEDDVVDPLFKARQEIIRNGQSRATITASEVGPDYRKLFKPNDKGQIESLRRIDGRLPGAPTLQDVAARLDTFSPALSPDQRGYLNRLREQLAPYRKTLEAAGDEFGQRTDIEPGGFYIPRGTAADPDAPNLPRGTGTRPGVRPGFERPAQFESQAAGVVAGREYPNFEAAVRGFVERAARRTADKFTENYLLTIRDVDGTKFGLTAKELLLKTNPRVARQMEALRAARDKLAAASSNRAEREIVALDRLINDPTFDDLEGVRKLFSRVRIRGGGLDKTPVENRAVLGLREVSDEARKAQSTAQRSQTVSRGRFKGMDIFDLRDALRDVSQAVTGFKTTYDNALRQAPHLAGRSSLGRLDEFPQLNGKFFPERMAARATELLGKEAERAPSQIRAVQAVQDVFKGAQATLDNSGVGIQTLLVAYNDPAAFQKALRVNARAFATRNAMGDFINEFNKRTVRDGRLTAQQLADNGLRVLNANEFDVTSTLAERIPVVGRPVRAANRAFAAVSNVARLEWADDLVTEELLRGRTIDDIVQSGDLRRIASTVNAATGIVDGQFSVANLVTFSARFLAARIKTLARAVRGLDIDAPLDVVPFGGRLTRRGGINPVARLEDKLARRAVLRMIGYGTLLTVAANESQGRDTDFRPVVGGKPNPNFMRVRAFNRDYSLFGPWDSLARLIASVGTGNFKSTARSLGSAPFASLGMDMYENKDFFGRPIIREKASGPEATADVLARFAESTIPFAADEAPENIAQLIQAGSDGRYDQLGIGALTALGESAGVKSSPLSNAEIRALLQDRSISETTRRELQEELDSRRAGYRTGAFERNPVNTLLQGIRSSSLSRSSGSSSPSQQQPADRRRPPVFVP